MYKENKWKAMDLRAQEREKQEKKKRMQRMFQNWGPIVLIVVVVVVLLVAIITSGGSESGEDSEAGFVLVDEDGNELDVTDWTEVDDDGLEEYGDLDTTKGAVVSDGDTVNIDYIGYHNGEAFEGGESYDEDVSIGSGEYVPGFEEGIVGHAVGETFDMPVTFPEDFGDELGGEDVVFTVTINGIYR